MSRDPYRPPRPYGPARTPFRTGTGVRARTRTPGRAPARTASGPGRGEADRAGIVAELADQIRDAIEAGDRWRPDYPALMERTGFRRSWCEKAVRDARTAAFRTAVRAAAHTGSPDRSTPAASRTATPAAPPTPDARTGRPVLHAVDGTAG